MTNNKYRVDWQAGMRLTEATFRAADDYNAFCLQPIYSLMAAGGYGFLETPVVRYEVNDGSISFTEIQARAITHSGKLISLSFNRDERMAFQGIALPDTSAPLIIFVDATSEKTVAVVGGQVPLCDHDYKIVVKEEAEHYSNPDAVPFARFTYNHGWGMDTSFIALCVCLRANGQLLRMAANYVAELQTLIGKLKAAARSAQRTMVMALLPPLTGIATEVEKEADAMPPMHLVCLMQQAIASIIAVADAEGGITVPEHEACKAYVESHYTPYVTSSLVNEGIRLTRALLALPDTFGLPPAPIESEAERYERPGRKGDTTNIRKKFH